MADNSGSNAVAIVAIIVIVAAVGFAIYFFAMNQQPSGQAPTTTISNTFVPAKKTTSTIIPKGETKETKSSTTSY